MPKVYRLPMRNWNYNINMISKWYHCVYRLPMRNWNSNSGVSDRFISRFIDYLWGIETTIANAVLIAMLTVYRLPMRNWNEGEEEDIRQESLCL